jgi:hypothetical protein
VKSNQITRLSKLYRTRSSQVKATCLWSRWDKIFQENQREKNVENLDKSKKIQMKIQVNILHD